MDIKVNSGELSRWLENASRCVDTSNAFLPMRGILLEASSGGLRVTASNGNMSSTKSIPFDDVRLGLEVYRQGGVLVPSLLFCNIAKKCPGAIRLKREDGVLVIENDDNKYEINLSDESEYPKIDFSLYGVKMSANAGDLREAIKNVLFAAASNDMDIIFSGVNIEWVGSTVKFIATDSYRVAYQEIEVDNPGNLSFNISLFAKNLKEFIPENIKGDVEVFVDEYRINVVIDNLIIQSKLIDAPYKDVSKVFPENFSKILTINKKKLTDAINAATVISSDSFHRLRFEISRKEMNIISTKEEVGNSRVVIKLDDYIGDDLTITINHKFLREALSVFTGQIQIKLNESSDRFVIVGTSNPKNKQLIAPQRSY